jgi:hypothetical protein
VVTVIVTAVAVAIVSGVVAVLVVLIGPDVLLSDVELAVLSVLAVLVHGFLLAFPASG